MTGGPREAAAAGVPAGAATRRVVVAGGGAVGAQLARALAETGAQVTVVEADAARADVLSAPAGAEPGLVVVPGNAAVAGTLEAAGALAADVLVACTGSDAENLVIALVAKRLLDVPRVVARLNDEADRWLFDGSWGVDVVVSAVSALVAAV